MKLKSFKDLETTSKVRTKDLVLPLRIDEQFSSRKKYGVNWGNAGVPNDLFFAKLLIQCRKRWQSVFTSTHVNI